MTKQNLYYLVPWPESQEYMDEDWFQEEAILSDDASYFIPAKRMYEIERLKEIEEGTRNVTTCCGSDNFKIPALICDMEDSIEIQGEPFDAVCNVCKNMATIEPVGKFVGHGAKHISNSHGVMIQLNKSCDSVRLKFSYDDLPTPWLEIFEDEENGSYVEYKNVEYFLKNFIKIKY